MRVDCRTFDRGFLAGKIILTPETPEEEQALREFRAAVGLRQEGRKLEIIYKRRPVGPEQVARILRGGGNDDAGRSG